MMDTITERQLLGGLAAFLILVLGAQVCQWFARYDATKRGLIYSKLLAALLVTEALRLRVEAKDGTANALIPSALILVALFGPLALREQVNRFRSVPCAPAKRGVVVDPKPAPNNTLVVIVYLVPWMLLAGSVLYLWMLPGRITGMGGAVSGALLVTLVVLVVWVLREERLGQGCGGSGGDWRSV